MIDLDLLSIKDRASTREYIVLDDVPDNKIGNRWVWQHYNALFKGQEWVTLTDKYRPKRTFKWGKPLIYSTNEFPDEEHVETLALNSVVVYINSEMF